MTCMELSYSEVRLWARSDVLCPRTVQWWAANDANGVDRTVGKAFHVTGFRNNSRRTVWYQIELRRLGAICSTAEQQLVVTAYTKLEVVV